MGHFLDARGARITGLFVRRRKPLTSPQRVAYVQSSVQGKASSPKRRQRAAQRLALQVRLLLNSTCRKVDLAQG